jgi:hypothetical protein
MTNPQELPTLPEAMMFLRLFSLLGFVLMIKETRKEPKGEESQGLSWVPAFIIIVCSVFIVTVAIYGMLH